ncbi:MAG: GNAT family N-acetyltransferase [Clostridia bacterium]|nr:GNAT family N-acetyltransferase [Clostridia bacterium]
MTNDTNAQITPAQNIRLATEQDIPALSHIWRECFDDPEEYIRFFYSLNFSEIAVPVYVADGEPVSMLHLFDSEFKNGEERRKAKLIYAAGTIPDHRNKGYMRALIKYVSEQALQGGYALFLKPATPYLEEYYSKFGFRKDACFRTVTTDNGAKTRTGDAVFTDISPEDYNRLRCAAFSSHPYAGWSDAHVCCCIKENAFCGGKTLAVALDGKTHFLMGSPRGKHYLITETDLTPAQLGRISPALRELTGFRTIRAFLPDFACGDGEETVSSVVFNAQLVNTYVNLIMI